MTLGKTQKGHRRDEILQALAKLLEEKNKEKISTARLAQAVGISEAALYRHFNKKAEMYDALIDFSEMSLMGLFANIRDSKELDAVAKIHAMIGVMLDFADVNRGITKVLTGHALVDENPELSERIAMLYTKFEIAFRQAFKEAVLAGNLPADFNTTARANMGFVYILGGWNRFVLSGFKERVNGLSPLALAPLLLA